MSQISLLLQRGLSGIQNIFKAPSTTTAIGTKSLSGGQQVVQNIKLGTASLSSGAGGRVLTTGAKVGAGVGIGGAGIGYGLTEIGKPITPFIDDIDDITGLSGTGAIAIIVIIILVLVMLLRVKK
jgi:hypothetical protein